MSASHWTGHGDGVSWIDPLNWSAGVPIAGTNAVFGGSGIGTVDLAGAENTLPAGELIFRTDAMTLARGRLTLAPTPAKSGNTIDFLVTAGAGLTVAASARIDGSQVAEVGDGTGPAALSVLGVVSEAYGVVRDATLSVGGSRGRWISGDSGLDFQDSTLTVEAGGRIDAGNMLAQYPAAALEFDGNCSGLVTGAASTIRLANTFVSAFSGTSTLTVEDGGRVFSGGGSIGGTGDGTLTITGEGSLFSASRGLTIGGQVPVNSRLDIENGGTVTIGEYGLLLDGTLALDGASTFKAPSILSGGGTIDALAGNVVVSSRLTLSENDSDPFETATTYLVAAPSATLTLTNAVSDAIPGEATTLDAASGHIVLAHSSPAFAGTTTIYAATLEIAAAGAAGTGGLDFVGGSQPAVLQIDSGIAFHNAISGFSGSDEIDLAGFADQGGIKLQWSANASGGLLTLSNAAHQRQQLAFNGNDLNAASFSVASDGLGGTALLRV